MGNCFSISISCDALATRCWDDCIRGQAMYVCNLKENLVALEKALQHVKAKRDDVMTRVNIAELQQLKRLNEVQLWLSSVAAVETEVAELIRDGPQEIEKLFLGGYCSKNCKSSYNFGKNVAQKLKDVIALKSEGDFKEVAQMVPAGPLDVIPSEPTVGLDSTFDKVWSCLQDENVEIIGLYGTGGVGKTTLLKKINNKFFNISHNFVYVIWVVVSKDLNLEKIQDDFGKKIGFSSDNWKRKGPDDKAIDISNALRSKKFVLLLDDIWERINLIKIGVSLPCQNKGSKIIFTTRSFEVCGQMEAGEKIKVECLAPEEAFNLFCNKVGKDTLVSHPKIPELAEIVAKECDGLPLALITIGRAMACKTSPEEWNFAIEVLKRTASEFPGMEKDVYPRLKFSYDYLPNETIRSCFLYCSLFPEDFLISKQDLIDYWNCEGFLGEYDDKIGARNLGYDIIGTLRNACLLEEEDNCLKMHDVIRDVALWITRDFEEGKQKFLVTTGAQLTKAPDFKGWKGAKRVSLIANHIVNLTEAPGRHDLLTLFLHDNHLKMITSEFFQSMFSLRVLDLSRNYSLKELPVGISKLISLEYLNVSKTSIQQLPDELKKLVKLKYLNLEYTENLNRIPFQLISSFSKLEVLRMFHCSNSSEVVSESILSESNNKVLVEELSCLKHLNTLTIDIKSNSALQRFLSSQNLQRCTQRLGLCFLSSVEQLNVSFLANMKCLEEISISNCESLQELKIDWASERRKRRCFESLCRVYISVCPKLGDLTWLILAPNLIDLRIKNCSKMEEIISVGKLVGVPELVGNSNLFDKLEELRLQQLRRLKSIYRSALPFPRLKEILVHTCPKLKKLPLNSSSAKENGIVIQGDDSWWEELEWEDEATEDTFLPCFKAHL